MRALKEIGNLILLLLNVWRLIPHDKYVHVVSGYFGFEILKLFYTVETASMIMIVFAGLIEISQKVFNYGKCSFWDWIASISTIFFYWILHFKDLSI